ncbi:MAG: matrixin family metalloprotease [Kofleriaceae bacterium]|nr:matrixin family metalloprotease [Kofleriaceae bacterium]
MPFPRNVAAAALGLFLSVGARTASAYDVATSSTGAPLHWETSEVSFALALDPGPGTMTTAEGSNAAAAAIAAWHDPLAGYGIELSLAPTPVAAASHTRDGVNTIRWAIDSTDPDREPGLLARTFAVYQTGNGALIDTDIVFDAVDFQWSPDVSNCVQEYDFANALTHELGHAVGLAHSMGHPEATMFVTGDACETQKRDLAPDDLEGLGQLYAPPPEEMPAATGCAASQGGGLGVVVLVVLALGIARRRRAHAAFTLGVALVAGVQLDAEAGALRHLEIAELRANAALVVRGRVVNTQAVRARGIETDATIVVDECLGGSCPRTLVVRRFGGELDGVGMFVDGEARLDPGDEVVLFVRVDRDRHARVAGGVQGLLRVENAGAVTRVVRDLRGHRIATSGGWRDGEREVFDFATLQSQLRAAR